MKHEYFITGCFLGIDLKRPQDRERCVTSALTTDRYLEARAICKGCSKAGLNPHLEQPPEQEGQIVPEETQSGEDEWVDELAGFGDDTNVEGIVEEASAEHNLEAELLAEFGMAPEGLPKELPKAKAVLPEPDPLEASIGIPAAAKAWGSHVPPRALQSSGPTVDELLRSIGIRGGPSLMGWSKLSCAEQCLRKFFYRYVMGLHVPIEVIRTSKRYGTSVHPLPLGSALHAVAERYYLGFFDSMAASQVLNVLKSHYPLLASETARLWNRYWKRFREEDQREWDVRAVEVESRFYYAGRTVAGKKRSLCITSRHDTVIRKTRSGARLAPGAHSSDLLHLHDLKTIGQMTQASGEPWAHEGQALQGMATWNYGYGLVRDEDGNAMLTLKPLDEIYGRAWGFTVTQIGKAKGKPGDGESYTRRIPYPVGDNLVQGYIADMGNFLYNEIAPRLFHKQCEEAATWRKSYLCRDSMTNKVCVFAPICESAGRMDPLSLFDVDPRMQLKCEDLELPKRRRRTKRKKDKVDGKD